MSFESIKFRRSLAIAEGGLIWVPGLEQETTTTSSTLSNELAKISLVGGLTISINEVLELIPGAEVKIYDNFRTSNKEILLPDDDIDWFSIIRVYVSNKYKSQESTNGNSDVVIRLADILPPPIPQD